VPASRLCGGRKGLTGSCLQALHNTHAPIEAPPRFIAQYSHFADLKKETFSAMVSVVDESVRNVTEALKAASMWDDTLFVWTTDNGSPVQVGGSNHPLRGGKGHNWEGGIRTPTFVCGGAVGPANRGKQLDGLMHITDWYTTFATLAGVTSDLADATAVSLGLPEVESMDVSGYIQGTRKTSPRTEIVHDHHMFTQASAVNGTCGGQDPFEIPGLPALGALRQGCASSHRLEMLVPR